jgi:hypothetical protein
VALPFRSFVLSKKCPMCNTVNDDSAESCKYCGYIFEGVSTARSATEALNVNTSAAQDTQPDTIPRARSRNSSIIPSGSSATFVLKSSWKDRRNLPSVIVGVLLAAFYIIINLPFSYGSSFSAETLIFLIIPVLFVLPAFTSNKTYEFFDNSVVISGIGSRREIPYSEVASVAEVRGRIYLQLKNQWRQIRVQGNTISNTSGQELAEWLSKKIKAGQTKESESDS